MAYKEHQPTARVIAILEILANSQEEMSLTEIARETGIPKGTISPVLHTLARHNIIFYNQGNSKYRIGIGAYCIGASYSENMSALQFIRLEMQRIVEQIGEICQMGILDGAHVLYVAKVDSEEAIRIISHVGSRYPANCTALGKAILSTLPPAQVRSLYKDGMPALTANSITNYEQFEEQLKKIRKSNIASEYGESNEQSNCIAVPLCKNGRASAAISISIPAYRHTEEKTQQVISLLKEARKKIELYLRDHDIELTAEMQEMN